MSPKLKKLTLGRRSSIRVYAEFLEKNKSQTLERIKINNLIFKMNLENVLPNYPALNCIETLTFKWNKPN